MHMTLIQAREYELGFFFIDINGGLKEIEEIAPSNNSNNKIEIKAAGSRFILPANTDIIY